MAELVLPIFPLPDVVHFPGTELPLHIFEPRYRRLLAELLEQPEPERRIGMVLAGPLDEFGASEILEPGCAGRLVEHEPLEDGRSNIVLLGEFRFVLEREVLGRPWRRAVVRPLAEPLPLVEHERIDQLERELARLVVAVTRESAGSFPVDLAGLAGLARPGRLLPLVNRLAAGLDLPALRKQALLADAPLDRAEQVAGILRSRLKLLTSLRPWRHLAANAPLN